MSKDYDNGQENCGSWKNVEEMGKKSEKVAKLVKMGRRVEWVICGVR